MSRSKKIFAAFAIVFALFLAFVVYDISRRTTFPGSKPRNQKETPSQPDTISADTVRQ